MTRFYTHDRQEVFLKQRLDMGGEGAVWCTNLPETVAKIYHHIDTAYAQKIQYMVDNPPQDPMESKGHRAIAWPQAMLFDGQGIFQGFLMPRVSGALQLNHIYNAKLRRVSAPGFTWHYLHVTAMNVASIMSALHAKNYVVGDLKTDNFLVTDRALVSIIDTDSFQIRTPNHVFFCPVGSEGFMPPELLDVDLSSIERTSAQDAFGLAILIHLLLLGYHPFSSGFSSNNLETPLSRDDAIAQGLSLYSKDFSGSLPPYVIAKEALHPAVQEAFTRCFNEGLNDPTKRPTADEWQVILQSVLWEIKQCGRAAQHFYFGEQCFWCKRLQETGIDIFSEGHHVRALNVDFRFQKAIDTQDLREIARLWEMHEDLHYNPRFQPQRIFIQKATAYVEALDQFKDFCDHAENDEEILSWWLDHEALSYFPHNPHERIQNRLVHEFLKDLRERTHALDRLKKAIDAATQVNQFGASRIEESLERAILKDYEAYVWPESFKTRNVSIFHRVDEARQNLTVRELFQEAYTQKNDQKLLMLWETERPILEKFFLTQEQMQAVINAEKMAKKAYEIQNMIKEDFSLDQRIAWWEKNPLFHASFFRHEVVAGLSIEHHIHRAQQQKSLLKDIQEASNRGDFQALSLLWDKDLCEGYKEFISFASMAGRAQEIYSVWQKVKRAIQEEEAATVLTHWDEQHFARPAWQEGLAPKVQKMFKEAYEQVQFPRLSAVSFENHKNFMQLRWRWPTRLSLESVCVVSISRHTQALLYIVKKRGDIGSALIPSHYSKDHKIQVWSAQVICDELLTFGEHLLIEHQTLRKVFYEIHIHKHAWRGWIKKFGPRVDLKFYSPHPITLPVMQLKAAKGRPPIIGDDRANLVVSIPSLVLAPGKKKTFSFFTEGDITTNYYRLEGEGFDALGVDLICRFSGVS
jgi:serine/threonine protein kinase